MLKHAELVQECDLSCSAMMVSQARCCANHGEENMMKIFLF